MHVVGGNIETDGATVIRGTGTNGETAHLIVDAEASTLHRLIETRNNNGIQFVVNGNNRVGIGVNNPNAPLHIRNTQSNTGAVMILQNTNGDHSSVFETATNPEGNITGFRGDLAIDGVHGNIYIKNSNDNTATGWVKLLEEGEGTNTMWDDDHDTGIQVEESADEDMIRFDTAGTQRLRINNNGLLSYGTEITDYDVAVFGTVHSRNIVKQETTDMAGYTVSTWGDYADPTRVVAVKARGTEDSETAVQSGDEIGEFATIAHDGNRYLSTGGLIVATGGPVGTDNIPSRLEFLTNSGGGNLGSDVKMVLNHDGNLGIGAINPDYKVTVENGALMLSNTIVPPALPGYAGIYTNNGRLYALDENGNSTQLSPHDQNGLWWYNSTNIKTGQTLQIEMERLMKELNKTFGGGYIKENGQEIDLGENILNVLSLKTNQNINSLSDLQKNVDQNLLLINDSFKKIDKKLATNQEDIENNKNNLETLSANINNLTELTTNLTNILSDHEQRISKLENTLKENGVNLDQGEMIGLPKVLQTFADNLKSLQKDGKKVEFTLNSKLVVKEIKSEKVETKELATDKLTISDENNIGTATIKAGKKKAVVETDKASADSHIILTPHGAVIVGIGKIKNGKSLEIVLAEKATKDIKVEWFIVNNQRRK